MIMNCFMIGYWKGLGIVLVIVVVLVAKQTFWCVVGHLCFNIETEME